MLKLIAVGHAEPKLDVRKIFCRKGLTLTFISGAGGLGGAAPQKLLGIHFCLVLNPKMLYSVLSKIFKEAIYVNIKSVGTTPYVVLSHTTTPFF